MPSTGRSHGPLLHHVGAVQVVAIEQVGDPTALGVERGILALPLQYRQAGGQAGFSVGLHDRFEDRPHHALDAPGIGLALRSCLGQDRGAEVARIGPHDVGGDAVAGERDPTHRGAGPARG